MTATIYGVEFVCDRAVKGKDWIRLYDGGDLVLEHGGITDFGAYLLSGGDWEPGGELEVNERIASLELQMTDAQMALVEAYEAADEQATVIMLAQAEAYETADRQNTDALLALAEVYESMLALQARVEVLEGGEKANG
ncbi:hypothetical protein [Anaerotruncus colihominis]|uniref:hypothetical protein n=1 Tax=Anaerotruncus colihominis TaxID=169435 RepID=UPI00243302D2|nr:hypothetical protein [Anaerotruncus colihominis]